MSGKVPISQPATVPESQHDWRIQSLNIHGVFFERWCQLVVQRATLWKLVTTNYPVVASDQHSALDIRADFESDRGRLILLIECKKNNPDFVDWIFFPKASETFWLPHFSSLQLAAPNKDETDIQAYHKRFSVVQLRARLADEARESRGDYLSYKRADKTRTSNTAISDAAKQVTIATQAIYWEEIQKAADGSSAGIAPLHSNTTIIPVIVTSANLFLCEFNPEDIDSETGEIAYAKARLASVPRIIYEYPLPRYLYNRPKTTLGLLQEGQMEIYIRRHIVVVHSTRFEDFLVNHATELLANAG